MAYPNYNIGNPPLNLPISTATLNRVLVVFDIHAYEEERACDDKIFDSSSWGIVGPEIMEPLSKKYATSMVFSYDEQTIVEDLIKAIKKEIWGDEAFSLYSTYIMATVNSERLIFGNCQANFATLLEKHLDPNHQGRITICILVSFNSGSVGVEYPLRFYVNSRESGKHHEPHIHVRDFEFKYEASVRISDGKILAGSLPKKYERIAREKILSEQTYFYHCWNTQTDGLYYDINKHCGIIKY